MGNLENMMIDQITLCKEDVLVAEAKAKFEKDPAKAEELVKGFIEEVYPKFFGFYNKAIQENPCKSGFAVGKKMTLADIVIFDNTDWIANKMPEVMDKYPEVKALRTKVASSPGIQEYLATRKFSPF